MKMLKPYDTIAGSSVNTDNIIKEINKFIVLDRVGDELAYEYYQGDVEIYFITGKTDNEKELPVFDFPLFFNNVRNKPSVAIDIRQYVLTSKLDGDFKLKDIVKDKHTVNFLILSTLLLIRTEYSTSELKPLVTNMISAMGIVISNMFSVLTSISPVDRMYIEVVSGIYAYTLLYPDNDIIEDSERLISVLSKCKFTYMVNKDFFKTVIENIGKTEYKGLHHTKLLKHLLEITLEDSIHAVINIDSLYGSISNAWYGHGGAKTMYAALESMPVFISLIYVCISSVAFKHSKLAKILDKNKQKIDYKHVDTYITNILTKKDLGELL